MYYTFCVGEKSIKYSLTGVQKGISFVYWVPTLNDGPEGIVFFKGTPNL